MAEDPVPARPKKRVAPDTHELELRRLAVQEAAHPECGPLNAQSLIWLFRAYNAVLTSQAEELRPLRLSP